MLNGHYTCILSIIAVRTSNFALESPIILHLGSRWRCEVSFTPRPIGPWLWTHGTYWTGGSMDPKVGVDILE